MQLNFNGSVQLNSYPIHIDAMNLDDVIDIVNQEADYLQAEKICIVTDFHLDNIYMNLLDENPIFPIDDELANTGFFVSKVVLPAGENAKSFSCLQQILEALSENAFSRNDIIIVFGGGSIGDICGLAASLYMRGLSLIQMPTSLLSMIDSSVGGKNAINLDCSKNLIGTFYQPKAVIINTTFLKTLPEIELSSAYGEILKYKVISKLKIFSSCNLSFPSTDCEKNLATLIESCLKIKIKLVSGDPLDKGERRFLNLGHSLGHAIETNKDFTIPHGIAVAYGIYLASIISKNKGYLDQVHLSDVKNAVKKIVPLDDIDFNIDDIAIILQKDKKANGNIISMVLPHKVEGLIIEKININEIASILKDNLK